MLNENRFLGTFRGHNTWTISAFGEAIMTEDPAIDLTFSEVVLRNDDKGFADKVKLVNDRLDSLCTKKNWGLISRKNIKAIHFPV
jgi:hypothetical protein